MFLKLHKYPVCLALEGKGAIWSNDNIIMTPPSMKQFKVKYTWWEWQLCTLIWTHQLSTFCWLETYTKVFGNIGVLGTHIDWYLPKRNICMYLQICAPNSVQFHSIQMLFNWQRVAGNTPKMSLLSQYWVARGILVNPIKMHVPKKALSSGTVLQCI